MESNQKKHPSHKILAICFFILLACVLLLAAALIREFSAIRSDTNPDETSAQTTEAVTAAPETTEPETTEAVTEPPVPFFTKEQDAAYLPSRHEDDLYPAAFSEEENFRVYAAFPQTDAESFNTFCKNSITSLCSQMSTEDTARLGGNTAVTIDYIFYKADTVYSCVIHTRSHSVKEDASEAVSETVRVLIYDTSNYTIYAPLDIYDPDSAYAEALSALIRAGYEEAFQSLGMEIDREFLDEICQPDPACFINIAMDDTCMYFYTVYAPEAADPVLLCSPVAFAALKAYEISKITENNNELGFPKPEDDIIPLEIPVYDISGAVPESEMVDDSYYDDALFIGNSLIVGLSKVAHLNARYFATIGLNVKQFFEKELIPMTDGTTWTMYDAIETVRFEKVYLMFGVNELGWGSITAFIDYYAAIIDRIREVNPNAVIYVQSILPINEEKWAQSRDYQSCINNVSVATFNQKIVEMCDEKDVYFVNVSEVLTDETGNLFSDATSDGIHIGGIYSTRWVEYLKTHTIPTAE